MSYEMSKKCFPEALCSVLPSACARAGEHSAAIRFYANIALATKFTFLLWGRRQNPIQVNSNR